MPLTAALLLAVTGGYVFSLTWKPSRYRTARESGHRTYFRAVFYGAVLVVIVALAAPGTSLLHWLEAHRTVIYGPDSAAVPPALSTPHLLTGFALTAFVLAAPLAYLLNALQVLLFVPAAWIDSLRFSRTTDERAAGQLSGLRDILASATRASEVWLIRKVVREHDFEGLVLEAFLAQTPLLVTLDNGKTYVGLVVAAPNPALERRSIRLLPLLGGYREDPSHRLEITTDYYEVIERIQCGAIVGRRLSDLDVVLPTERIAYVHLFDLELYLLFDGAGAATSAEDI